MCVRRLAGIGRTRGPILSCEANGLTRRRFAASRWIDEGTQVFGRARAPIPDDERQWLDDSWEWLIREFGLEMTRDCDVVVPHGRYFPDYYDGSDECLDLLVSRVASYMRVKRDRFALEVFSDDDTWLAHSLPAFSSQQQGAAGLYFDPKDGSRLVLALEEAKLDDPAGVVATTAHELAHIHLLADGRVDAEDESHEYLTDLLTVFLGLGVFTANAAFQFSQWEDGSRQGWEASASGYLSEGAFGYSLALHALIRGERKPDWSTYLNSNITHYFKRSASFLKKGAPSFTTGLIA